MRVPQRLRVGSPDGVAYASIQHKAWQIRSAGSPESARHYAEGYIGRLVDAIAGALDPLIPAGTPCALLGFPNHNNVGDNAIWLGERSYLKRRKARLVYRSDVATFSCQALAGVIDQGPILLHGGGNLGDVWPVQQSFREQVITTFPSNPIIQLPQTIHFRDPAALERARRVFSRHDNLVVLVRDVQSAETAEALGARAVLCPDLAFGIGALPRPSAPSTDITWLARQDIESSRDVRPIGGPGVEICDWLASGPTHGARAWRRLTVGLREASLRHTRASRLGAPLLRSCWPLLFDALASRRVSVGLRLLSRGRVVITDRLHGHILCLLLGMPHVILDNNYGKVTRFRSAFPMESRWVQVADSPASALEVAFELVGSI